MLFVLVILPLSFVTAQQNGSFESWSPSGSPPPFDWKFPTGWTTNNATTEFITAGVTRNNYNYAGEFAAQIKTLNIFGTYTRSQLALGNCKLDPPNYQLKAYTGGEPLLMIPDEVSFYYQLTTGVPAEYAVAEVLIKRGSGSAIPDTVYHASMNLPAVDIYTAAHITIPDVGINTVTDSIVILFSSNDTNEVAANILYVDAVSIDFSNAVQPTPGQSSTVRLYPNPVRQGENLTIEQPDKSLSAIEIFDSVGKRIGSCFEEVVADDRIQILTRQWQPGIYFIVAGRYCSKLVVSDLQ